MADTKQISATIRKSNVTGVGIIVKKEARTFSQVVDILLNEALEIRKKKSKL